MCPEQDKSKIDAKPNPLPATRGTGRCRGMHRGDEGFERPTGS